MTKLVIIQTKGSFLQDVLLLWDLKKSELLIAVILMLEWYRMTKHNKKNCPVACFRRETQKEENIQLYILSFSSWEHAHRFAVR